MMIFSMNIGAVWGLLRFSPLAIGDIATRLGYPRIHEFSREFTRETGKSPSVFRRLTLGALH